MHISELGKRAILSEMKFVVESISRASSAQEKLYFFGAVSDVADRLMNQEFEPELAFLRNVVTFANSTMRASMLVASQGQSISTFPPLVFDKVQEALSELATLIEADKETYPALQKLSTLAYSTTPSGYYLFLRGQLKVL